MRLADYTEPRSGQHVGAKSSGIDEGTLKERVRDALYEQVPSEKLVELAGLQRSRALSELAALTEQAFNSIDADNLDEATRKRIIGETVDMIIGLGPLERLLADDHVTEIMANGPKCVFYEKGGILYPSKEVFDSEDQLRQVVDRIVSPLGRRVDEQQPIVNARLSEGHRVNVVIPPISLDGTALTIRKFRPVSYSLDELVSLKSLTKPMAMLLTWAVRSRKNIAVSGGTGGGKTTLLNALSQEIPHGERIVTIEDAAELRFDHHPHVVRMEARMANAEGRGAVTIRDLVVNALRMRPDRIVVGECRGAEALDMLQAMNTGHDGSLTTLHAGSPAELIARLVMMVRYGMDIPTQIIEAQIISALDLVVQQDRLPGGVRRVTQIAVKANQASCVGDDQPFQPVVEWSRSAHEYRWRCHPLWLESLVYDGFATEEEVEEWKRSAPLP